MNHTIAIETKSSHARRAPLAEYPAHGISIMVTLFLVIFAGPSLAGRGFELR